MMFWVSGFSVVVAAVWAALARSNRDACLAVWICGMALGGVFLGYGMEFVAIIQWVLATLIGVSLSYYATLFGEQTENPPLKHYFLPVLGVGGMAGLLGTIVQEWLVWTKPAASVSGVRELGAQWVSEHGVSLEILGVVFLLTVVGSSVIARPELKRKRA